MIRTPEEYEAAIEKLASERAQLDDRRRRLEEMGLAPEEVERALAPLLAFQQRLADRIAAYERRTAAAPGPFTDLRDLGAALPTLRERRGLDQATLATRLDLSEEAIADLDLTGWSEAPLDLVARALEALEVPLQITLTPKD